MLGKILKLLKIIWLPLILISAYIGFGCWARWQWGNWQISGVFGDTFGAFNALVATLALAASLYTLFAQVKQTNLAVENEKLRVQPILIPILNYLSIMKPQYVVMPDNKEWYVLPVVIALKIKNVSENPAFNLKFDTFLCDLKGNVLLGSSTDSAHPYVLPNESCDSTISLSTNSVTRNLQMIEYFSGMSRDDADEIYLLIRLKYQNQLQGCFEIRQGFSLDVKQFPDARVQAIISSWRSVFKKDSGQIIDNDRVDTFNIPSHIRMNSFTIRSISRAEYDKKALI